MSMQIDPQAESSASLNPRANSHEVIPATEQHPVASVRSTDSVCNVPDDAASGKSSANKDIPSIADETSQNGNRDDSQGEISAQQHDNTNKTKKRRLFGISKEQNYQGNAPPDDYDKRYQPDEFGQEMGPSARVWRVYLDEAGLSDHDMVEGWKDGIDVLLVFAGLFSAVVTTFVTQTSTKLDKDYSQISASLLTELIAIQRAIATAAPLDQVQASEINYLSPPQYSKSDVWVNGLWFISLTLSLSTALFAVLVKQWIQHYTSFVSGSILERAHIHQFRYSGLDRWGVRAIIGVLPLLLYVALFLFILGLAVFLQALKPELAYVVTALGGTTFILYAVTNVLPIFYPKCPYRTPLIEHIHTAVTFALFHLRQLHSAVLLPLSNVMHRLEDRSNPPASSASSTSSHPPNLDSLFPYANSFKFRHATLKTIESNAAKLEQDKLTQEIIEWLLTVSSNPSVNPIALQSISGLPVGFSRITEMLEFGCLVRGGLDDEFTRQLSVARIFGDGPSALAGVDLAQFYNTERIVRASIFAPSIVSDGPAYGDELSVFPRPPLNWKTFDESESLPSPEKNIHLWQALTTYRVLSIDWRGHETPSTVLRSLGILAKASSTEPYLSVWNTWCYALSKNVKGSSRALDIATAYSGMWPLFEVLMEPESSPRTWIDFLPTLCHILHPQLVNESFGCTPDQVLLSPKALPAARINLRSLLLLYVVTQLDIYLGHRRIEAFEGVVRDSCDGLSKLVDSYEYKGKDASVLQKLAVVLDRLVSHVCLVQNNWKVDTYDFIFDAYFKVFTREFVPLPTSNFSSLPQFQSILEREEWVSQCLISLRKSREGEPSSSILASQIVNALHGQAIDDPKVKNIFSVFPGCFGSFHLHLPHFARFTTGCFHSWPIHLQALVRWMLDCIIDHSEAIVYSHAPIENTTTSTSSAGSGLIEDGRASNISQILPPPARSSSFSSFDPQRLYFDYENVSDLQPDIDTSVSNLIRAGSDEEIDPQPVHDFAADLLEHEGFLACICSPFLISPTLERNEVVFSEESSVLVRLAEHHKRKGMPMDAWRTFLLWVKKNSSATRAQDPRNRYYDSWTTSDFDKYDKMADFVDGLASTIGLDDPELKVPRFEESYKIKILQANKPSDTTTPGIGNRPKAAGPSSHNHPDIQVVTTINPVANEGTDPEGNYYGTSGTRIV